MSEENRIEDEFALIKRLSSAYHIHRPNHVLVGNGDDAAIFQVAADNAQVVCIDTLVEGIHFTRRTMSPYQVGYKCLAVNLSDIAAMGGQPLFFLVSLAVPAEWTTNELHDIYEGLKTLADEWQIDLLGGDTVSTQGPLVLTVTAIGQVEKQVRLVRSHARPGDILFLTGFVGQAAAGLDYLLHQERRAKQIPAAASQQILVPLLQAHQLPRPHLIQGQCLATFASHYTLALNDISDGLASEAHELATSSQVALVIEKEKIPLSYELKLYAQLTGQDAYSWAFNGGEDFVLVGTVPQEIAAEVEKEFNQQGLPFYRVGFVEKGDGEVWLASANRRYRLPKTGYNHFT